MGASVGLTYFKRFQMEIDLTRALFEPPPLSDRYAIHSWKSGLLDAHAHVKYRSFCYEVDANVFPCLGDRDGCLRLMREISRRDTFVPEATWLLSYHGNGRADYCGTVQGIRDRSGLGAVQNLGITPDHRGQGLGTLLLYQALDGFRRRGLEKAVLEVTAQNSGALRLYRRLGFRKIKTVYKAVEVAYA